MDGCRLQRIIPLESIGVVACIVVLSGCPATFPMGGNDLGPSVPQDANIQQIVQRVNANIEAIQSWKSSDVRISGPSLMVPLSGRIAVERPRNFRLAATALGMDEADFGSNPEWFWFWVKRGQPPGHPNYVFQAKHEDIEHSQSLKQIPFQPDWLMEALGVVPVDPKQVTLHHESRAIVDLIAERLSPSGTPVKKVVRVDLRRGVVLSHSVYDSGGNLIAKAVLDKHERDRTNQTVMPHLISLEWPRAGMQIVLEIGHIDVNPRSLSPHFWEVPDKRPLYPPFDLGARERQRNESDAVLPTGATSRPRANGSRPGLEEWPQPEGAGNGTGMSAEARTMGAGATDGRQASQPISREVNPQPAADIPSEWSKPIEAGETAANSTAGRSTTTATISDPFGSGPPGKATISEPAAPAQRPDPFATDDPAALTPPAKSQATTDQPVDAFAH